VSTAPESPQSDLDALWRAARDLQGEFVLSRKYTAGAVAAALRAENGRVYTGLCLELACGIGFCAEHSAVAEMLKDRVTRVTAAVAVGQGGKVVAPCGRCRELLLQVNPANAECCIVLGPTRTARLGDLVPSHWLAEAEALDPDAPRSS